MDSSDMYVSVDLVEEIIERQIKKYKTKIVDKKQNALAFNEAFLQEESEPEETVNIVKTKRFAMKTDGCRGGLRTDGTLRTQLLYVPQR